MFWGSVGKNVYTCYMYKLTYSRFKVMNNISNHLLFIISAELLYASVYELCVFKHICCLCQVSRTGGGWGGIVRTLFKTDTKLFPYKPFTFNLI